MARNEDLEAPRQNARARLAALREKKPPRKAAQIRALWPEIKAALDNGHSLKAVCDCLKADGISISVQTLGSYITRMRRESLPLENPEVRRSDSSGELSKPRNSGQSITKPSDSEPKKSLDRLTNLRDRQGRRPAFDYRPELADPKKLI
jgi:hypothetical protein